MDQAILLILLSQKVAARAGMTALGVPYVAGIQPNTLMWRSGNRPKTERQAAEQYRPA